MVSFLYRTNIWRIPMAITRRQFLAITGISSAAFVAGCAINPVTGKQQLLLVSEGEEIAIDRENAPHQFSADYGPSQDAGLSAYLEEVTGRLSPGTHRPKMPYRAVPLNATYINAYTFPGGSMGITRGILLDLESEAELAALMGHEMGHVNARHTAQRMTKGLLTSLVVSGVSGAAGKKGEKTGALVAGLGNIAGGALLASYSRDNEREADKLAMEYMTRGGYNPGGHMELMDLLRSLSSQKASAIELMFSTHPMSDERYASSRKMHDRQPARARQLPMLRERYMDNTAALRALGAAIEKMQTGDREMAQKKYASAESRYGEALRKAPGDYAGLLSMAKCQLALEKPDMARRYAEDAYEVYPAEPQAIHLLGMAELAMKQYAAAREHFTGYEKLLRGNPNTVFYIGYTADKMGEKEPAADRYYSYLKKVNRGDKAEYAYKRLQEWGYVK
jgi:predicted Zn-dependent protease